MLSENQLKVPLIFFSVLDETKFLPRYIYHRSLLHSFGEKLQNIPEFKDLALKECCILLGGSVNNENRIEIFNEAAPCKETLLNDLPRGKRIIISENFSR